MRTGDATLFPLIHDYLKIYLPNQRNVSPNTLRSYRKALEELLDFVKEQEQIPPCIPEKSSPVSPMVNARYSMPIPPFPKLLSDLSFRRFLRYNV